MMALNTMETGRMMFVTEKGSLNIPMEINMMVTGRMIFNMEKVLITFTRATVMRARIS